jgi:hypothetical protein
MKKFIEISNFVLLLIILIQIVGALIFIPEEGIANPTQLDIALLILFGASVVLFLATSLVLGLVYRDPKK